MTEPTTPAPEETSSVTPAPAGVRSDSSAGDPTTTDAGPADPATETEPRPHSREARYRLERNEARDQADALTLRVAAMQSAEVARIASEVLAVGEDVFTFVSPHAVLDADGNVDRDKVLAAAYELARTRPGLRTEAPPSRPSESQFGQGRRTSTPQASWRDVLHGGR